MSNLFGDLLRETRLNAGRTMGDLARLLGFKVPYISDVERGRRAPFRFEQVLEIAEFLGVPPDELLEAAAVSRGAFELDAVGVTDQAKEVGTALMRGWTDLGEDDLAAIAAIVSGRNRGDKEV